MGIDFLDPERTAKLHIFEYASERFLAKLVADGSAAESVDSARKIIGDFVDFAKLLFEVPPKGIQLLQNGMFFVYPDVNPDDSIVVGLLFKQPAIPELQSYPLIRQ